MYRTDLQVAPLMRIGSAVATSSRVPLRRQRGPLRRQGTQQRPEVDPGGLPGLPGPGQSQRLELRQVHLCVSRGSIGDICVELHGAVWPVGGGVPLADDQMQVLERRAGHEVAAVELSHPPLGVVFGVP